MSYQNQSDKDHLDIILGPPAQDKLIETVHIYASKHDVSIDKAWSECAKNTANNLMKPNNNGFNAFSNERAILKQRRGFTTIKLIYPPTNKFKQFIVRFMTWRIQ